MKERTIAARISFEDAALIERVAKLRGEGLSSFIRRALRKELASLDYLDFESKRALGLRGDGNDEREKR